MFFVLNHNSQITNNLLFLFFPLTIFVRSGKRPGGQTPDQDGNLGCSISAVAPRALRIPGGGSLGFEKGVSRPGSFHS